MAEPNPREVARAKNPHELFMLNLIAFHLLLTPAALALEIGAWGLALTPTLSGIVIAYIHLRARRAAAAGESRLVAGHWAVAWRRCRLLLLSYAITAAILLGGWALIQGIEQASMQDIMFTVITRVGVMPVVVMVFVTAVLESGAIYQAGRGEVPGERTGEDQPPPD